jgi:transcriptional regulator with XRE-family HTH domain
MADNRRIGSDFDDFLAREGLLEETSAIAMKRVIAWQLAEAMKRQGLSKAAMAARMGTSRTQVDRILGDQVNGMTLETLGRAVDILGLRIKLEIVEPSTPKASRKKALSPARRRA